MRSVFLGLSLPHTRIPPISLYDCTIIIPLFKRYDHVFKANPLHSLESRVSYLLQVLIQILIPSLFIWVYPLYWIMTTFRHIVIPHYWQSKILHLMCLSLFLSKEILKIIIGNVLLNLFSIFYSSWQKILSLLSWKTFLPDMYNCSFATSLAHLFPFHLLAIYYFSKFCDL